MRNILCHNAYRVKKVSTMKLLIIYGVILAILAPAVIKGFWKACDEYGRQGEEFMRWLRRK